MPKMTPQQEAAYALDNGVARADLAPHVRDQYDRLARERRLVVEFPALGVQVRGDTVEGYETAAPLGPLAGAQAVLTDGTDAWDPATGLLLGLSVAGLAKKKMATAFVIFTDKTHASKKLNGNRMVREAQAEAIRFNLLAGRHQPPAGPAPPPVREDPAEALRTLGALHDEGLLTDEEYQAKRAEVIARI